jgi:spoIIIJ-associated protein
MESTWREFSAKTIDEAVTEALAELMITLDKLEYEIVDEGKSGFLGIGAKPAVIKARVKSSDDLRDDAEIKKNVASSAIESDTEFLSEEKDSSEKKRSGKSLSPAEIRELADIFLKDVFSAMEIEFTESSEYDENEGELVVTVDTPDKGILIGKRGQTLDSLQYLTSLVVNKESDKYIKVKIDSEDYRARRKETLENLARNIASKVKRTGHSVSLEPMNSFERRIIHSALQLDEDIDTHSEGAEPYRKVVVSLTKEAYAKRKSSHYSDRNKKPYGRKSSYGGYSHGGYKSNYSNRRFSNDRPRKNDRYQSEKGSNAETDATTNV